MYEEIKGGIKMNWLFYVPCWWFGGEFLITLYHDYVYPEFSPNAKIFMFAFVLWTMLWIWIYRKWIMGRIK